jgi:BASS family bile acid:Na+ symporter
MPLIDLFIAGTLALVMFGIGTSINLPAVHGSLRNPSAIIAGLLLQMLALPAIAFLVATCFSLSPEFKMGIVLVSLCPGGTTSNFISYLLKADVALSLCLTTINSLLILITIPLFANLGASLFMLSGTSNPISISSTAIQLVLLLLVPTALGCLFNHTDPDLVKKYDRAIRIITSCLLAAVFIAKASLPQSSGGTGISLPEAISVLPACLAVHFGSMFFSYLLSRKFLTQKQSTTIAIEVGLQNTALAILIAAVSFQSPDVAKPALVVVLFSFWTTLAFGYFARPQPNLASATAPTSKTNNVAQP